jgi:two-component system response regulator HydG
VGCCVWRRQRNISNVINNKLVAEITPEGIALFVVKLSNRQTRAQMSAQLSRIASINIDPDKRTTRFSPWSSDPNFDVDNHDFSASQSNSGAEVMSVGDCSKALAANPTAYLQPIRLLVVDESDQVRQMCCEAAENFGFVGVEAGTIPAARKILARKDTAILMLDLTRQEGEGQSLVAEMKSLCPNTLLIGMSASATIASAVETMRTGASDYLSKPFPLHVLAEAFERAAKRLCFDVELRKLQEAANCRPGMGDALGQSVEMENLYRILFKVAGSRHSVMIVGENGTGKDLVAKSIHSNGPDCAKPFVSVDCNLMSSDLLESTLFGGLKGPGTQKRGLLAALEGGTVFIDGIESLPLDLQGRLVRALKEKKIFSAGGTREHSLSVRILTATSHDLTQRVRDGRFRIDLYRFLSLVNLKIPPLRGRPGDIVFLAERFLEKIGRITGIFRTIPQETLRVLETYDWPENTQELESAVGHACILSSGTELETNHLPQNILTFCRMKDAERKSDVAPSGEPKNHRLEEGVIPIATMEKRAILMALRQTNGDRRMAAGLLGIGKTTLYRKLKEYSLDLPPESRVSPASPTDATPAISPSDTRPGPFVQNESCVGQSPHRRSISGG